MQAAFLWIEAFSKRKGENAADIDDNREKFYEAEKGKNLATKEDIEEITKSIEKDKISSANRKRLHAAVEKLSHLTPKQQNKILDYIHKYKSDIPYNEATKKYSITNNTELQFFLWGIEERYFSTIAKREKRMARSILKLR